MRFRLKTFLIVCIFLSVFIGAFGAHRRAHQIAHRDWAIADAATKQASKLTQEYLVAKFMEDVATNPSFTMLGRGTSKRRILGVGPHQYGDYNFSSGGIIDGPIEHNKSIRMLMHSAEKNYSTVVYGNDMLLVVNADISYLVPWRFFPGKPQLTISGDGTDGSRFYIDTFKENLPEISVEPDIDYNGLD